MNRSISKSLAITLTLMSLAVPSGLALYASSAFAQEALRASIIAGDKRPIVHGDGPKFGVYDPHGDFSSQTNVSTEHLFLPWEDVDLTSIPAADQYALQRGRKLLVTIEPWSWGDDWKLLPGQLRDGILAGKYDANMSAIADVLATLKSPLIVRWGQEMEDQSGRFSWAGWAPEDYIAAYKRMNDIVRAKVPGAQIMWSPKGLPNMNEYYPGDDQVDLVGLSVFGLDEYDMIVDKKLRKFAEVLEPGYKLALTHNKPIWVAELGYEGRIDVSKIDYMEEWAKTVTLNYPQFSELKEVVYFNDKEVHPWPHDLGYPDWRVVREATN